MRRYLEDIGVRRTALQPLGVDADVFSPDRGTLDLRRELGLAADVRLLVYAGRFSAEKNLHVLRGAFARLGPGYHLLLVGGGEHLRPAGNVSVVPYRRSAVELASWLASCDALVHAGCSETFGLVIVEAMACGLPVVAARAGAVPELVDEGVGLLATPFSASDLAAAIAALYERDRAALGAEARRRVLERHTWDRAFPRLFAAYAALDSSAPECVEAERTGAVGHHELPAVVRPAHEDDLVGNQIGVDGLRKRARVPH